MDTKQALFRAGDKATVIGHGLPKQFRGLELSTAYIERSFAVTDVYKGIDYLYVAHLYEPPSFFIYKNRLSPVAFMSIVIRECYLIRYAALNTVVPWGTCVWKPEGIA